MEEFVYGELEGTGFEILDPSFSTCLTGHGRVERLWTGARWAEGPAWFAAGRYLIFSDIPNNRLMRWDETDGSVSEFRSPSNCANGNTVDQEGRLITCEHRSRRVTRTEHDGSITIIADKFEGKKLNSPNDVVIKSDGSIWFTDPTYGIISDYEGQRSEPEQTGCFVYRVNSNLTKITAVARDFTKPNGITFNSDETALFISDTGRSHQHDGPKHIRRLAVQQDGETLGESMVFADCNAGLFDGFRIDTEDRVWTSASDGVHCFNPVGKLIGKIIIPEMVANVCFGGASLNRLFIAGTTSIYSVYLTVTGQGAHTRFIKGNA